MSSSRLNDLIMQKDKIQALVSKVNSMKVTVNVSEEKDSDGLLIETDVTLNFKMANTLLESLHRDILSIHDDITKKSDHQKTVLQSHEMLVSTVDSGIALSQSNNPTAILLDAKQNSILTQMRSFTGEINKLKSPSLEAVKLNIESLKKLLNATRVSLDTNKSQIISSNLQEYKNGCDRLGDVIASYEELLKLTSQRLEKFKNEVELVKALFFKAKDIVKAGLTVIEQAKPKDRVLNLLQPANNSVVVNNQGVLAPVVAARR
jgi:hypothetical protein